MADAGASLASAGSSFDWGSLGGAFAGLLGNLGGGLFGSSGDAAASKTLKKIYKQQRADTLAGKTQAEGYLAPDADQTGADNLLRGAMVADPSRLTPSQQIGLEDLTRTTINNLKASGLAGAGRAGQATLADATRRYLAGAHDTNQQRSDQAASLFSNRGANTRASLANVATGTAGSLANEAGQFGQNQAALDQEQGATLGNMITASGQLVGSTLGAINGNAGAGRSYNKYVQPGGLTYDIG